MNYTQTRNESEGLDEIVGELHLNENNLITSKTEHKSQQRKTPKIVINASLSLLIGLINGMAVSALNARFPVVYYPITSSYLALGGFTFPTSLGISVAAGDKPTDALIFASYATLGTLLGMYLQRMI